MENVFRHVSKLSSPTTPNLCLESEDKWFKGLVMLTAAFEDLASLIAFVGIVFVLVSAVVGA